MRRQVSRGDVITCWRKRLTDFSFWNRFFEMNYSKEEKRDESFFPSLNDSESD